MKTSERCGTRSLHNSVGCLLSDPQLIPVFSGHQDIALTQIVIDQSLQFFPELVWRESGKSPATVAVMDFDVSPVSDLTQQNQHFGLKSCWAARTGRTRFGSCPRIKTWGRSMLSERTL
jgi:hypothetical protein